MWCVQHNNSIILPIYAQAQMPQLSRCDCKVDYRSMAKHLEDGKAPRGTTGPLTTGNHSLVQSPQQSFTWQHAESTRTPPQQRGLCRAYRTWPMWHNTRYHSHYAHGSPISQRQKKIHADRMQPYEWITTWYVRLIHTTVMQRRHSW